MFRSDTFHHDDRGDYEHNGTTFCYTFQDESVNRITGEWVDTRGKISKSTDMGEDAVVHKVYLKESTVSSLLKEFVHGYSSWDETDETDKTGAITRRDEVDEMFGGDESEWHDHDRVCHNIMNPIMQQYS